MRKRMNNIPLPEHLPEMPRKKLKFKSFSEKDLEETMNQISAKLKAGCSIDDALFYIRCYGAIEELLRVRSEVQQDV